MTVLVAALVLGLSPQAPTGSIAGCASDQKGQRLPRTTVVVQRQGAERTTEADANGCYEMGGLPAGTYRVTVQLKLFDNATADRVVVSPSSTARADVVLRPSPICECVIVPDTPAAMWSVADAVLHVRLSAPQTQSGPRGTYRHDARLLHVLKAPATFDRRPGLSVFQSQASGAVPPYPDGQEVIVFLSGRDAATLRIVNDLMDPGLAPPAILFVQDGRVSRASPGFSQFVGRSVDAAIDELRQLGERR
jgi:hypothetical protein